ncbi:MAG TPA: MFS transporter [Woeseiaceae bacterium]|nr:MFS transporter [Woeseiaceae bacterium]
MSEVSEGARRFPTASPDGEIARVLLAFLATAGIFYVNIMPAIVDGLIEGLNFSNREAGLVASSNTYGAAFGAFIVVFFVKRLDWRKASYALLLALLVMDLGSIVIQEAGTMIAARAVHGFVGGALVGIGFSVMSRTSEVSRTFGYLLTIQFGLGGLGIIYLPPLAPVFGTKALFLALAAFSFVTLLMVPFLASYPAGENHHGRAVGKIRYLPAAAALLATFLFQAANMGIYAYSIGIGKFAGLTPSFVSDSFGVAAWVAIAGSVLVILISTRFGRLLPVAAATWALHHSAVNPDSWLSSVFWLAQLTIGIMWAFVISYLLGMNAEFDATGQMAALGGFASKMGLASGPAVAAMIVGESNYGFVINVATVALVLALFVVLMPARVLHSGT